MALYRNQGPSLLRTLRRNELSLSILCRLSAVSLLRLLLYCPPLNKEMGQCIYYVHLTRMCYANTKKHPHLMRLMRVISVEHISC